MRRVSAYRDVASRRRTGSPTLVPMFATLLTKRRAVDHCLVRSALCRMS
jgi:hypothetical protein